MELNGALAPQADVTARCAFIFSGYEVSIGFSGRCDANGAAWEATALAGKRCLRLAAELKLLHRTDRPQRRTGRKDLHARSTDEPASNRVTRVSSVRR
jgi:hypothetical protein